MAAPRQTTLGPARHVDLWTQVLDIMKKIGYEVQWLHVPSHIGIRGNDKADTMADEGRRRSPLLRGYVSAGPTAPEDEEPPSLEVLYQEPAELPDDPPPPTADAGARRRTGGRCTTDASPHGRADGRHTPATKDTSPFGPRH